MPHCDARRDALYRCCGAPSFARRDPCISFAHMSVLQMRVRFVTGVISPFIMLYVLFKIYASQ
jgi:hypothetical protein